MQPWPDRALLWLVLPAENVWVLLPTVIRPFTTAEEPTVKLPLNVA